MRRGEIWWADVLEPIGSEPGFSRPAVIISADSFNSTTIKTVIVVLLYSNLNLVRHPGNVLLAARQAGLDRDCVANVTQIATVDRQQLSHQIGMLPPSLMTRIDSGLRLALQL